MLRFVHAALFLVMCTYVFVATASSHPTAHLALFMACTGDTFIACGSMDTTVSVWKISRNVPSTPGGLESAISQSTSILEERVQQVAQMYRQNVKKRVTSENGMHC